MRKAVRVMRLVPAAAAALMFCSCSSDKASISLKTAVPGEKIVLTQLDVNRNTVLDTLMCDENGDAKIKVKVPKGDPDFFFLFKDGKKMASLVLGGGDKVKVEIPEDGNAAVSGNTDSELFQKAEHRYAEVTEQFDVLSDRLFANKGDVAKADGFRKDMGQLFVSYYRECLQFVMEHPKSMASVGVLFQRIGDNLQVFATDTDVAHFKRVRDSLAVSYPKSRYLKTLDEEIDSRDKALTMRMKMSAAEEVGFPDLILPDLKSEMVQLSSVDAKVIVLHFWIAAEAEHNIYNAEVLKPVFSKFRGRGLQIYQVSYDVDKAVWARNVNDQKLGWINVNDRSRTSALSYNVDKVPQTFVIADGVIVERGIFSESELEKIVSRYI